jgi:tetratricopeptide (TPR) repeat protein
VTRTTPNPARVAVAAAALACVVALLALVNRSGDREEPPGPATSAGVLAQRGAGYLQRARDTGDPNGTYVELADRAFRAALRRDPRNVDAAVGLGMVALNGHDFRGGLRHGLRARRLAPDLVRPYAVVVDAQLELGRYGEAGRSLQRMIDLKPNLASYARASYYRELHGDLAGAAEAMRLAVSAGGDAPEQVAYVQTLLGDLGLKRGRVREAEAAYRLALARLPGYVDARFGLARAAVAHGRLRPARRALHGVVRDRPDADHLALLAEVELVLGRRQRARAHLARAHARERRALASGANPDAGAVLLEADWRDPRRALRLARRVWELAPSVTSADALGWALTRAGRPAAGLRWARRALRLGSLDPRFHYHLGMAARGANLPALARRELGRALAYRTALTPVEVRRAERALR